MEPGQFLLQVFPNLPYMVIPVTTYGQFLLQVRAPPTRARICHPTPTQIGSSIAPAAAAVVWTILQVFPNRPVFVEPKGQQAQSSSKAKGASPRRWKPRKRRKSKRRPKGK